MLLTLHIQLEGVYLSKPLPSTNSASQHCQLSDERDLKTKLINDINQVLTSQQKTQRCKQHKAQWLST